MSLSLCFELSVKVPKAINQQFIIICTHIEGFSSFHSRAKMAPNTDLVWESVVNKSLKPP